MKDQLNTVALSRTTLNASFCPEPQKFKSMLADLQDVVTNTTNHSFVERSIRNRYINLLNQLDDAYICLVDPIGTVYCGDTNASLKCELVMHSMKSYTSIALGGSNGSAQAYIDGLWSVDDLTVLIRIFARNRQALETMDSGLARLLQYSHRTLNYFTRNTRNGSKKNIAAHYDLGNEFFRLFLDQKMMYSSALYNTGDTLEQASERKLQRICDVLELSENDHVIEIGTGWGGFACYAASVTGCKVTSVTISQEQYNEAKARVIQQGLDSLVTIELKDYRDVEGQFDKLVSIEMIEAVGHQYLGIYFEKLNQLLKPKGKALIQAIVIDDQRYKKAVKEVDFIKKYIFPGGFMPCYSTITEHAGRQALMLEDMYDMGFSYAQTLRDWRQQFYAQLETVNEQGYGLRFQRMWEFYFCYCEAAFEERATSVGQLLFRKQDKC
ncbi:MAG: cyclopropane-fatty-acyl-phospholipid synthase [Dinoroseobacter sp.]|jgi:cyclopropane-fatty-acyl-phospholipid synthase